MAFGRRQKQEYITIPREGTKPEWLKGVSTEELFAAHGKNIGGLGSAEISYRLETIGEEVGEEVGQSPLRVLVAGHGEDARKVIAACLDAGLAPYAVYAGEAIGARYAKAAVQAVALDDAFSEAVFSNGYALLSACEEYGIAVILDICPDGLAAANYHGLATSKGIRVYKPVSLQALGAGWIQCRGVASAAEITWRKCAGCGLLFDSTALSADHYVCPSCGGHFRMSSDERIRDLLDAGSFVEWDQGPIDADPLEFAGYVEKVEAQRTKTGLDEAVRCGVGAIAGVKFALGVMDAGFFMGSLGSAVGEKVTRMVERATEEGLPVVIFTASGGARMQEGLVSLMQMAKVSCALNAHAEAGLLYISVLCDPTTGGVTASYAMQADIILAEPHALIGFAGKRVIRDTIRQELPEGFQTAEFALEHGLIDAIVERADVRARLAHILAIHESRSGKCSLADGAPISYAAMCENLVDESGTYNEISYGMLPQLRRTVMTASQRLRAPHVKTRRREVWGLTRKEEAERRRLQRLLGTESRFQEDALDCAAEGEWADFPAALTQGAPDAMWTESSAWKAVKLARDGKRPTSRHYIDSLIEGFIEFHGDRAFADDGAIIAGIGWFGTRPVTVIAQEKGTDLNERLSRNFGCAQPEGYRKAMRAMRQAEKFGRPIICLIDTQGAFCGIGAEERGQGNAIAESLLVMASLKVPVVCAIVGEGGSGGALALALGNKVAMQENAVYSILSPEGFASILWKDRARAPEAAAVMRMTAQDAHELGVVDAIIPEGEGSAKENPTVAAAHMRAFIADALDTLENHTPQQLADDRYRRFRKF